MMFNSSVPARLTAIVAVMFLWSAAAQAIEGVVVVDTNELWNESLAGKDVQRQLLEKQEGFLSELETQRAALAAEVDELRQQKDALEITEAAFNQRLGELRQQEAAFQQKLQENNTRMQIANRLGRTQFYQTAEPILIQLTKEKGGAVLIEASQILYHEDEVDITEQAIERLDRTNTSLAVNLDPPGPAEPAAE